VLDVLVALGDRVAQHGHRLVGVELHLRLSLRFIEVVVLLDNWHAPG